uniref:RNA-directed DNA polymerase, eukaryota n=1 Tax=Tanacetum cinerariifolium TaxID=118510 RepID=A0A699HFD7_TANCI|nr:RNA-directed DNA polymerase, eukaryota [Tanacetum cinerariifolium]
MEICNQYGNVIDVFIPNRRSKVDDSCLYETDYTLSMVGKLNEFGSPPNLKKILMKEGFADINIRYMGGFWVLFKFLTKVTKDNCMSHVGVNSWFSKLQQASKSFSIDEKITWIDIEGVLEIHKKEDIQKDVFSEKASKIDEIPETVFEEREHGEIMSSPTKEDHKECVDLFSIKSCWGNLTFDSAVSPSMRNSRGILCVWDSNMFHKENSTVLNHFIAIMGKWIPNDKNLLIISVYAPQELAEKKMLWRYLQLVIDGWKGDVMVMSDFNEVRTEDERFSSIFNPRKKDKALNLKKDLKIKLVALDASIDKGNVTSTTLEDHMAILNNLTSLVKMELIELAQKAKIKWSIEGDENTKYYHGIINKQQNNLAIWGIIVVWDWIKEPHVVKNEFLSHFRDRFDNPGVSRLILDMDFPNNLSPDQIQDLERMFTKEAIKRAVWDCGLDKSPDPDGFTFGFYRRFCNLTEYEVVDIVNHFFNNSLCPKGGNSSFVALIPKTQGAKMVKDLRPISLIGSTYKIIAKLLANRLVTVMGAKKKQTMIFKVDFKKAFDSVRWDFLDDVLKKFGFVMESLHLSFQKVVNAGLFKGVDLDTSLQLSHLFYANDVAFIGQYHFFNGVAPNVRKMTFVKWDHVLASKDKGETPFKTLYLRIYALESDKSILVAAKMAHLSLGFSLRRDLRGGIEQVQMAEMLSQMEGCILPPNMLDRWSWPHSEDEEFSVSSTRNIIDGKTLGVVGSKTHWCKYVPSKVNIHSWRVKLNSLPTCLNLSRRSMDLDSILCPSCNLSVESTKHIFFTCPMMEDLYKNIAR